MPPITPNPQRRPGPVSWSGPGIGAPEVEQTPKPALAPGIYSGVWPDLVMTAYVDENGANVKVPKVKVPVVVDAPPPGDLAAIPEATE